MSCGVTKFLLCCKLASLSKPGSSKSLTFLIVCRNLPGKANLKNYKYDDNTLHLIFAGLEVVDTCSDGETAAWAD